MFVDERDDMRHGVDAAVQWSEVWKRVDMWIRLLTHCVKIWSAIGVPGYRPFLRTMELTLTATMEQMDSDCRKGN